MKVALKTDVDKAKVRTAIKIYLSLKGSATARQLCDFILDLDLKLRGNISPTIITAELDYCMTKPNLNFLKVSFFKDTQGRRRYYLDEG